MLVHNITRSCIFKTLYPSVSMHFRPHDLASRFICFSFMGGCDYIGTGTDGFGNNAKSAPLALQEREYALIIKGVFIKIGL